MEKQIKPYTNIGSYHQYNACRFCGNNKMKVVIDLGTMPLAGGFFKKGTRKEILEQEKVYPLQICFCPKCYLVQVNAAIHPDVIFKDYFYFSSSIKTLVDHFQKHVEKILQTFPDPKNRFIVEIGCNDATMITGLQKKGFKALGIDPATNVVTPLIKKGIPIINDYFSEKVAKEIVERYGKADAIYSFHAMAHIENMHDVVKRITTLLKNDGYLAFEVHYLGSLLDEVQYDMMYHEHQFYYSLLALQKFFKMYEMEIFDVAQTPIRAGSIMYFVQHKKTGKRKITQGVSNLLKKEKTQKLDKIKTYQNFARYIEKTKKELVKTIKRIKNEGKTIIGYGASGRGTIIMNYCDLSKDLLDYVVDDAPAKYGAFTPGTHHMIHASEILDTKKRPDYAVLFAWPFFEEVKKRKSTYLQNGGRFIVPLPKITVFPK